MRSDKKPSERHARWVGNKEGVIRQPIEERGGASGIKRWVGEVC